MGYASAMAWLLFVIIMAITAVQIRRDQAVRLLRRRTAMTAVDTPAPRITAETIDGRGRSQADV